MTVSKNTAYVSVIRCVFGFRVTQVQLGRREQKESPVHRFPFYNFSFLTPVDVTCRLGGAIGSPSELNQSYLNVSVTVSSVRGDVCCFDLL